MKNMRATVMKRRVWRDTLDLDIAKLRTENEPGKDKTWILLKAGVCGSLALIMAVFWLVRLGSVINA